MAKILVVDDEPANRALIRAYLADTQHELLEASDGETSLALIAEAAPDLVLLDVLMPGLDGFATLRRLRERHDGPFLPVLLVTALSDQTSKRRGLEAGADDFLLKPVDPTELLLRVGNLLRLRDKSIEQRARNEELAELHRFKDEMVGLLVHDLKNPLSALSANLAYIQGESASMPEEVVAALNDSSKCARRLGDLLQNLADTQRAEVAALRPTLAPVALREWLMSFKGAREWEAREHGLHLEIDADGGLRGLFDAALLSRVVENLLDNALRYTPRDGRIVLLAEAAPDGVTISVGNTGPEIPVACRERLFDKFAQHGGGQGRMNLGLGLYFCRLAVEAHGGSIRVEGDAELPTRFVMRLPSATRQVAASPAL